MKGSTRRGAGRHRSGLVIGAALVMAVVVGGCEADYAGEEPPPDPEPTVSEPVLVAGPGDVDDCFAVADAYLSVTLLRLESAPGDAAATSRSLGETADSIDDILGSLPEDVRAAFREAADELRDGGDGLSPHELMEVRDALEPAHTWLNDHCSNITVEHAPEPD